MDQKAELADITVRWKFREDRFLEVSEELAEVKHQLRKALNDKFDAEKLTKEILRMKDAS